MGDYKKLSREESIEAIENSDAIKEEVKSAVIELVQNGYLELHRNTDPREIQFKVTPAGERMLKGA